MNCSECMFSVNDGYELSCHRYPPTVITHTSSRFPTVYQGQWCGEFKQRFNSMTMLKLMPRENESRSLSN